MTRWRFDFSLVVLITLLATMVRFWDLDRLPPQAWDDEVWFASRARDMLQTGVIRPAYPPMDNSGNAGLVYSTAVTQWSGIRSLVSARLSTAMAGVLAVPLAYACFRQLLVGEILRRKKTIALMTTILMAGLPFLIVLARIGMEPGLMPAAMLLVIWLIEIGLQRRSWLSWGLAGLVLGLSQYYGLHFRFLLPLAGYLILDRFVSQAGEFNLLSIEFWNAPRRAIASGTIIMLVVSLLACLPLITTFIQHPGWLTDRAVSVTQNTWGGTPLEDLVAIGSNAARVAGSFLFWGDAGARHNPPGSPMLDLVQGAGFLVGIGWAIRRVRSSPLVRMLLVCLGLMALPSILADYPPNFERMVGVAPAVVGLVSLGWTKLYDWLSAVARVSIVKWFGPILLVASLSWNLVLVFGYWANAPELHTQFTTIPYQVFQELVKRSVSEPVYVERIPVASDPILFEFMLEDAPAQRINFHECLPLVHRLSTPASYVVLTSKDSVTLEKLVEIYPLSIVPARDLNLWQEGYMTVLEVPTGTAVQLPEYHPVVRFESGISLYGYDLVCSPSCLHPGGTLQMAIYWAVEQSIGTDLTSFVHIAPAGVHDQPPVAQYDGPPCTPLYPTSRWQPGEIILDWVEIPLPTDLPPGKYEINSGWYDPVTSTRVGILEADQALPDGRAIIGDWWIDSP